MIAMKAPVPKPVIWMGDSLARLKTFPSSVQDEIGYALYLVQIGGKHVSAKPLKGLGVGVLEVVSDHRGDTFRAVYTSGFRTGCTCFTHSRRNRKRASPRHSRTSTC